MIRKFAPQLFAKERDLHFILVSVTVGQDSIKIPTYITH